VNEQNSQSQVDRPPVRSGGTPAPRRLPVVEGGRRRLLRPVRRINHTKEEEEQEEAVLTDTFSRDSFDSGRRNRKSPYRRESRKYVSREENIRNLKPDSISFSTDEDGKQAK